MQYYDANPIEKRWQEIWEQEGIYTVPDTVSGKKNFFALVEFSYPSGNLHVGHWYAFAVPDSIARYKRMNGYNVLYPMGFDAFGLPAENAAIKQGGSPKDITYNQMDTMRTQLRSMGASFDWSREIVSCDPSYYRWTQWMFAQFLKNDLVYRASTKVNWCEKDKTILANEQVHNGACERCGTEVVQKNQEQWMFRITRFADALVDDLDSLAWPSAIKEAQKNWIGRSEGSEIDFMLSTKDIVPVFTTRADTLPGVTYIVLAPEHTLVSSLVSQATNGDAVLAYQQATQKKSELDRQQSKEKTGVCLEGITATHPLTGEQVSVWIADYVLAQYGTGAVMAVPAHDERDALFAATYNLPIKQVIAPHLIDHKNPHREGFPVVARDTVHAIVYSPSRDAYLALKWHDHPWTTYVLGGINAGEDSVESAQREVYEETGYTHLVFKKHLGSPMYSEYGAYHKKQNRVSFSTGVYFELIDEEQDSVSEQEARLHTPVWIPAKDFTQEHITNIELQYWLDRINGKETLFLDDGIVIAPEGRGMTSEEARRVFTHTVGGRIVKKYRLRDWGISRQRYWGCPIPIVYDPQGVAHYVGDEHLPWLLPEDVDCTPDGTAPLARSKELQHRVTTLFGEGWTPEVETMDTFVDSSWYFYRYLDPHNQTAFASLASLKAWAPIDLYMGGAEHTTMHLLYSRFWVKALHSIGLVDHTEAYKVRLNRGLIVDENGEKMSKSKGNVVNPDEVVERLGADTVRLYLAFIGPYGATVNYPWDPNGVVGVRRFLERVWKLKEHIQVSDAPDVLIHKTIKKVGESIETNKLNTAIASLMIALNHYEKQKSVSLASYELLLQLLSVFAPHMTESLWRDVLGHTSSIHLTSWPTYDTSLVVETEVIVGVQVNGKIRGELSVSQDMTHEEVLALARAIPTVAKWLEGMTIKKELYLPNKIISFVV